MYKIRLRRARGDGAPRKRMSYANVAATLALVLALGGGTAWAAQHYLITSTNQIKPSVLKSLRGYRGYRGYRGANGTNGANGATGATGATGANLTSQTPLPSGQSESGFYGGAAGSSTSGYVGTAITYVQPLATAIADANVIWNKAGTVSLHCAGYGHADRGYLCLYDLNESGLGSGIFYSNDGFSSPSAGAILYWTVTSTGSFVSGEYTVTAP
jgi:hypothetical protein